MSFDPRSPLGGNTGVFVVLTSGVGASLDDKRPFDTKVVIQSEDAYFPFFWWFLDLVYEIDELNSERREINASVEFSR